MENYQQDNDKLYRYLFQHRGVRGEWVRLNKTFQDTLNTHHYPKVVQNLLGEMMVATALLTATLKFKGQITLQLQGDEKSPVSLALVNGTVKALDGSTDTEQSLRAVARLDESQFAHIGDSATLQELFGKGVLVITLTPEEGERYQGVVELSTANFAGCLERYFAQSEQLATQLLLFSGEHQGEAVTAGLLLQVMPDGTGSAEDFEHLTTLAATATAEEMFALIAHELLYRLFHEETVEIYPPQQIEFFCGCSKERSMNALLMVPETELSQIFDEQNGKLDMQCECCGTHYEFTPEVLADYKLKLN